MKVIQTNVKIAFWTGKNKTEIKKSFNRNIEFIDDELYINKAGGYIKPNSEIHYLVDYGVFIIK